MKLRMSVACSLIVLVVAAMMPAGALAQEIVPNAGSGLFQIRRHTAPLVNVRYVAWGPKWKYSAETVKVAPLKDGARDFTMRINNLDIDMPGQWHIEAPNRMSWNYKITFNKSIPGAVGGGMEFRMSLGSPVRKGATAEPVLREDKSGWSWEYLPGETATIRFDPPLAALYFERGNKGTIRAMFYTGDITAGKRDQKMTIELPEGGRVGPALDERYGPTDTSNWFDNVLGEPNAFIDVSFMNHKPAGKHGAVKVVDGEFQFADGTPVRFWGANVQAYSLFMEDKALMKLHAKRIAALGFNLIRLHHHDSARWVTHCLIDKGATSQKLNEKALDSYFWWIKCLRDEGVYIWVDLMVGRTFREGDNIPGWSDLAKRKGPAGAEGKGFNYINPRLRELMKDFNEQLLTRKNPHTGLALKDDPAVMGALITNENELTGHFGNVFLGDKGHPYHTKVFNVLRDAFAKKFGLPVGEVGQTWVTGPSKLLLNDLEAAFNRDMIKHLRGVGLKAPIATCHLWGGNGLLSLPALTEGEIIDTHAYTSGEFLSYNPRYVANFMHWIGQGQVIGKTLAVTEYNIGNVQRDPFTVPLYVGAIGAFQGWDAPMLYGYSQHGLTPRATSPWSAHANAGLIGLMPAAAVMFRQGHVQPAKKTVVLALTPKDLIQTRHTPTDSATLRTVLEQHRLVLSMPATKELPWLKASPKVPGATVLTDADVDVIPEGQTYIETDTGEIRRDWKLGIQTINTPKSQAAIGWLKGQKVVLADVTFSIETPKAAVALTSLDGKPLSESERILVSAVARTFVKGRNTRNLISEPVAGTLTLKSSVKGLTLFPLKGADIPPQPLKAGADGYTITLPTNAKTHWFLLTP
jgi:hypothetical protein